ncbi:MAG: DUF1566 domain-containing protein [Nitrospiraceae bacterium]
MQQRRPHSRVMVGLLSLAVLVGAALTSSLAQADTGAGPYFAPPAWNRTLPSAGRFLVLTNFASLAVLDRETGLVWEKSPSATLQTWLSALAECAAVRTTGGRKGWRLPSMPELASLIDPSVASPGPTLPAGHPFTNVQSAFYWSASTLAADPANAWLVGFGGGDVTFSGKANGNYAWCVRGAMNADAY